MRIELTTPRLVLRPIAGDDARMLHELWTNAGVRRFLWDDEIIPMARTEAVVEQSERLFADRRCGLWAAWTIDERQELAGFGGLWPFRDPPELELLYGVAKPLWGRVSIEDVERALARYSPPFLTRLFGDHAS
jgi:RimJ/RimL family protein N-acetyltransferase